MMKRNMLLFAAAAALASPAMALEHEVVIDHAGGPIAADYQGSVTVETRQVGTPGVGGRVSTLACKWTASLNVERMAKVGDTVRSRRTMTRSDVAEGSRPGWCETNAKAIDRIVEARRETFRTAMLAMVEQDRSTILAEADSARNANREG